MRLLKVNKDYIRDEYRKKRKTHRKELLEDILVVNSMFVPSSHYTACFLSQAFHNQTYT